MLHLATSPVLCQAAAKSWKMMFSEVFCCQVRPDPLFSSARNGYETFGVKRQAGPAEQESGTADSRKDSSERSIVSSPTSRRASLVSIPCQITNSPTTPEHLTKNVVLKQPSSDKSKSPILSPNPTVADQVPGICHTQIKPNLDNSDLPPKKVDPPITQLEEIPLSPISDVLSSTTSGIMSAPSSMEFSQSEDPLGEKEEYCETKAEPKKPTEEVSYETKKLEDDKETKERPEAPELPAIPKLTRPSVLGPLKKPSHTEEELLLCVNDSTEPSDILTHIQLYQNRVTPLLAINCVHHIYLKALNKHPRNSVEYNALCGNILTSRTFRDLIAMIEDCAKSLNNFALLTVASDLLYLRLTLKKPTIPTLLSHVDFESMNLEELRLLASCLHTPNIPLINSEYMYNVSAAVATRYVDSIGDLYTLLNIMKCFGRYFANSTKRQCESRVVHLSGELNGRYPDGRSMAAHMFDAFYRMEHAPLKPLLQQASDAIVKGKVTLQPQDVSAILRYFVKFGYTIQGNLLLDRLSDAIHERLPHEPASQFTTNIKWLTVFYYYNRDLLELFIGKVLKHISSLDFVALSDVLDALAQVYYVPENSDEFFDCIYKQMLDKFGTLNTSHVHNASRKLVLTVYHFAVFGRYPKELIDIALSPKQIAMQRNGSRSFLRDLCKALSIERPDLLPSNIPNNLISDLSPPKPYAFEKDVQHVLYSVVGGGEFFSFIASPLRSFPLFLLRARLDGSLLPTHHHPTFIPPHMHQQVQNIAVVPLPRSRFCIGSKHATGKTRLGLRLLRAQGCRVITVPHFDWDGLPTADKSALLRAKIFEQKMDDPIE